MSRSNLAVTEQRSKRKPGPKKGAQYNTRTKFYANLLAESSDAPLKIMLDNMLFWARKAEGVVEKLERMLQNEEDPDVRREIVQLLGKYLRYRDNAQSCAVDAAPYIHPKLASVEVTKEPDENEKPQEITMTLLAPEGEEDRSYREAHEDGATVVKLRP